MNGYRFAYSSQPQRLVREVQFGVLSPEEIVGIPCAVDRHHDSRPLTLLPLIPLSNRRKCLSSRLSSLKQQTSLASQSPTAFPIHVLAPSIATSSVRLVVKAWQSALVISVISTLRVLSITLDLSTRSRRSLKAFVCTVAS